MKNIRERLTNKLKYMDYYILIPFFVLTCIGIVMVYSASSSTVVQMGLSANYYLKKQALYAILSFIIVGIVFLINHHALVTTKAIYMFMIVGVGISLLFLIGLARLHPSSAVNGATAWIRLGPINIEPSELAKLTIIMYLAYVFANHSDINTAVNLKTFYHNNARPITIAAGFCLLILLQPDTGGMTILATIIIIMIATSGMSVKNVFKCLAILIAILTVGWLWIVNFPPTWMTHSYQYQRIVAFLHPFKYAKAGGTQLVNSYYAIVNGGAFGRGIGQSIQKRGFLPEPYTDFIMSVITEELGVVGAVVILALLFFMIGRIILVGIRARKTYNALICFGVGTWLFIQTCFNIGGMLGLLPITGVTLPFISYGGTSMIVLAVAIGLVLNVDADEKKLRLHLKSKK